MTQIFLEEVIFDSYIETDLLFYILNLFFFKENDFFTSIDILVIVL